MLQFYLDRCAGESSTSLSDITAWKLQLIALSKGWWKHAAALALLSSQWLDEAQAGMNAALLGARQTESVTEFLQPFSPQSGDPLSASPSVDEAAKNMNLPLQHPTGGRSVGDPAQVDPAVGTADVLDLLIDLLQVPCNMYA